MTIKCDRLRTSLRSAPAGGTHTVAWRWQHSRAGVPTYRTKTGKASKSSTISMMMIGSRVPVSVNRPCLLLLGEVIDANPLRIQPLNGKKVRNSAG